MEVHLSVPDLSAGMELGWTSYSVQIPSLTDEVHQRISWALRLKNRGLGSLRRYGIRAAGEIHKIRDEIQDTLSMMKVVHANLRRGERCSVCGLWRKRTRKIQAPPETFDPGYVRWRVGRDRPDVVTLVDEIRSAHLPSEEVLEKTPPLMPSF